MTRQLYTELLGGVSPTRGDGKFQWPDLRGSWNVLTSKNQTTSPAANAGTKNLLVAETNSAQIDSVLRNMHST
jgi:hypothetical protein